MIKCSNCGNEVSKDAKFCSKCGCDISEQQKMRGDKVEKEEKEEKNTVNKCSSCGNEISEDTKFCSKCGGNILEQREKNSMDILSEKEDNTEEKNNKTFYFKKVKWIGRLKYKIIQTEARSNGNNLEIDQNIHRFLRKDKESHVKMKLSEISSIELKVKMDFWDVLYAVIFGVLFLMDVTNFPFLLVVAICLYTGYGKILNLKMNNGLTFEIPVNGLTEDVEKFQSLIRKG